MNALSKSRTRLAGTPAPRRRGRVLRRSPEAAAVHRGHGHHNEGQHQKEDSQDTQQTVSGQQQSGTQTTTSEQTRGHGDDHKDGQHK
jgi:hypothetical protein